MTSGGHEMNPLLRKNMGIPRHKMPQLSGIPPEGTRAASLPRDPFMGGAGVDLSPFFWQHLALLGIEMRQYRERVVRLRATQSELDCKKIETLIGLLRRGAMTATVHFISSDRHIVDGHHRWAAELIFARERGVLRHHAIYVSQASMPICDIIRLARAFAREWGLPEVGV